ncbi:MAG: AmmeMemoRadiSam system protein B [Candidatus Omnitrophica bacterium]|nr:AmmeMemoRadiSam system protein B [Candidatus Omnitrophota bacterium]
MIRRARVAGQFYPASPIALRKQLDGLVEKKAKKEEALGLVSPHAGYIFSGKVAGICFSQVKLTESVIILGPNHAGLGAPFSIMAQQAQWQMPMGDVEVDVELAEEILKESKYLAQDVGAHTYEHSIEVQLPFLQYFLSEVKIVPIILSSADVNTYDEIGKAIAKILKETKQKCLIVASSDMTHYEPQKKAEANDKLAIEAILNLDEKELFKRIEKFNITMCGYGPVICMLCATKQLGAKRARLVKYETSGEASGDYSSVVGYAGLVVI